MTLCPRCGGYYVVYKDRHRMSWTWLVIGLLIPPIVGLAYGIPMAVFGWISNLLREDEYECLSCEFKHLVRLHDSLLSDRREERLSRGQTMNSRLFHK